MVRNSTLNGIRLRDSAYAKPKASGRVTSVTSSETQTLCQSEVSSEGWDR